MGLTLASLILALSGISSDGRIATEKKSDQNNASKTESSKQVDGKEHPVYDIDGKRLRADEEYLAAITLDSGRIVAYRKNKREIAALVKALKESGVTDKKRLDPNAWMMNICGATVVSGCNGGCGIAHHCKGFRETINRTSSGQHAILYSFCFCVPN